MEIASLIVRLGADMADLIQESKKANTALDGIGKTVQSVGNLLKTYFGAQVILGAVNAVLDLAGAMTDLSAQTGIGVEALQELKIAGGQVGLSLETITGAITKMQNSLASGDKSAIGAIKDLGLSLAELDRLSPDQQFLEIARALKEVKDPAEQIRIAMDLFGKSGAEALKLVNSDFDETIAKAREMGLVLDRDTIGAFDDLGDTLDTVKTALQAAFANLLIELAPALIDIGNLVVKLTGYFRDAIQWINSWDDAVNDAANAVRAFFGAAPIDFAGIKKAADDAKDLKHHTEDAAAAARAAAEAYTKNAEALEKAKKEAAELARHQKEIADIRAKMTGKDVIADMKNALEAMAGKIPTLKSAQEDFVKLWERYKTVVEQTGGSLDGMYAKAQAAARQMQGLSSEGLLVAKKPNLGGALYTDVVPSYEATNKELESYLALKQEQTRIEAENVASVLAMEEENKRYIESLKQIPPEIQKQNGAWNSAKQAVYGFSGQVQASLSDFMNAFDAMYEQMGDLGVMNVGTGVGAAFLGGPGNRWTPTRRNPYAAMPGFATGTDGYEYFGSGTPVMLHGWEKVTPKGAGEGGGAAPVVVNMSGLVLSSTPSAREELRRVVNDAIASGVKRSRKFSY